MDIKEYAVQSRLPLKALSWMVNRAVVNNPLTRDDILGLSLLEKIWGSTELIRSQIKRFSKLDRLRLIETCDFDSKWEAYAHTRFKNATQDRVRMTQVIDEIEMNYEMTLDFLQRKKLYSIREKIYNQRRYRKKKEKV